MPQYIKHKKRGTKYAVVGDGFVQTDVQLKDYDRVTVYRAVDAPYDEELVIRRHSEMLDGRFEDLGYRPAPEFWINLMVMMIGIAVAIGIFLD